MSFLGSFEFLENHNNITRKLAFNPRDFNIFLATKEVSALVAFSLKKIKFGLLICPPFVNGYEFILHSDVLPKDNLFKYIMYTLTIFTISIPCPSSHLPVYPSNYFPSLFSHLLFHGGGAHVCVYVHKHIWFCVTLYNLGFTDDRKYATVLFLCLTYFT